MSDTSRFPPDESGAGREGRRARMDYGADDYNEPSDWSRAGGRPNEREDPRDRGTPFLAFAVIILLAAIVTVALWFVLKQQELRPVATGGVRVRIERPSLPSPDLPRLPRVPTAPPTT